MDLSLLNFKMYISFTIFIATRPLRHDEAVQSVGGTMLHQAVGQFHTLMQSISCAQLTQ